MPASPANTNARRPLFPFISGFEGTYIFGTGKDILDTTEHAARFRADLTRMAEDGITAFRACIPWHHIEREKGSYAWSWTDAYLACARELNLDVIADPLHHTSFPDWLEGGFADPEFGPRYLSFLRAFAERYPWIRRYTIINEPFVTTWFCGGCGLWHPHQSGPDNFVPMLRTVARTICEATELLTGIVPDAEFLHTDSCEVHSALDRRSVPHAEHGNRMRFGLLDLALGRVDPEHDLFGFFTAHGVTVADLDWFAEHPMRLDVLGLDYYSHSELVWSRKGRRKRHEVRGFASVAMDYVERYRRPVMLAETNLRGTIESRTSWLKYMVGQCELLQRQMAALDLPFAGFCWYPFIDSTDWDSLVRKARGRIDPQGIYWLDGRFGRNGSELSRTYAELAQGKITAADIVPQPFDRGALNQRGVANFLPHMPWAPGVFQQAA